MKVCSLDYETTGLNYWEEDFRVLSAAFVFQDKESVFCEGEDSVGSHLLRLIKEGYTFVVHNASFEWGVTFYRYDIDLPIHALL